MSRRLPVGLSCAVALLLLTFPSDSHAEGVGQVFTSKSIPAATVALIDPESGSSAGGGTTDVKVAVGDVILFQFNFSGVPDLRSSGLQSYLTEFIPDNTQVVGVRLIDRNGLTITPRLPGVSEDSCTQNCPTSDFDNLPCSAGSGCGAQVANQVDLDNGTIAQVHADTGIFYTTDPRMARDPADTFSTLANGINMSALGTEPIDATDIDNLIGVAMNADFFGHAFWDYVQMKAYGWKNSALSGNSGNGPTPFLYGSPVAGPQTYYRYEATNTNLDEATVLVEFNDTDGPWGRIQYPGSLIGTGSASTTSSTNLPTRMGVPTDMTNWGWDLRPNEALPDNARALRYALGEVRVGEVRAAEVALRVLDTPLDSQYGPMGGDIDCADVFGSDVSSESSGARADTNPWSAYLPSPSCVFLNLLFDLSVSKPVADGNDILTYTMRVKNLSTNIAGQTNVQVVASYTGSDFNFVSADGGGSEALCPGGSGVCPAGIGGGGDTCICWPIADYAPSDENTFTFQLDVGGTGSAANVVFGNYISDSLVAPGFTTQALTIVKPVAVLEARLGPDAAGPASPNTTVGFSGSFQNLGNQLATMQDITFVLPAGWSLSGTPVLSEGALSGCSGTDVVTCTFGGTIVDPEPECNDGVDTGPTESPDDDLVDTLDPGCIDPLDTSEDESVNTIDPPPDVTFTMDVNVPPGTPDGLYNIEIQTYHTQMGIGGDTESYFDVNTARATPLCSDGLDNDGDMLFDYPDDPECESALDDDETAALSYVGEYGTLTVGQVRSARPILDCPIGDPDTQITGVLDASTPLNATVRLYFNGIERASGTATAMTWTVGGFAGTPACMDGIGIDYPAAGCDSPWDNDEGPGVTVHPEFGRLYGGLEIRATATGNGELESELSEPCFVSVVPACLDGIDNDMDGLIDFPADPGCSSATDGSEEDPVLECSDGIDNDSMNGADYPTDPSCQGPSDDSEDGVTACDDGVDNDGDGLFDWDGAGMGAPDPGCCPDGMCDPNRFTEVDLGVCQDGVDNDGDLLVDFPDDPGCHSANDDDEADITPGEIKSRLFMIMDTSGSMNWNTCVPEFTGGDGSLDCAGTDVVCADLPPGCTGGSADSCDNGFADDSRLFKIKEGVADVVAGFGDVEYSLMRFQQKALDFACPSSNASALSGGWQGAGADPCGGGFNAGEMLVNFGPENHFDLLEYMDHTTNWSGLGDPPPGLDFELRGSGTTPLAGALNSAELELGDLKTADLSSDCRPYINILLTDGQETCGGDPVTAAADLLAAPLPGPPVETYVIGFATEDPATVLQLNNIANAGSLSGTRDAIFVDDAAALSTAMSQIVSDSVLFEICDGDDDDCDLAVDEGFTLFCDLHSARDMTTGDNQGTVNHPAYPNPVVTNILCVDPGETVCDGQDDNCNGTIDEGFPLFCDKHNVLGGGVVDDNVLCTDPGETLCDGIDDNCNGVIDEDNVCDGCIVEPEICDGLDNDCDVTVDEDVPDQACGVTLGQCMAGTESCVVGGPPPGTWENCDAVGPTLEVCDGFDNDCDGVIDGNTRPCVGGTDVGICQAGVEVCIDSVWGGCVGGIGPLPSELCNGLDDDCDGTTDEDVTRVCGVNLGECSVGIETCVVNGPVPGAWGACSGQGPVPEVCNERDDDCDGVVNDGVPTAGNCGSDVGECSFGVMTCIGAAGCEGMGNCFQCVGEITGGPEACDNRDNDCNGMTDDGIPDRPCGISTGECTTGTEMCVAGNWVNCTGQGPVTEMCDLEDDDCDGVADENVPSGGPCPTGTDEGQCDRGSLTCIGGSMTCVGAVGPSGESCNNADDDCDMLVDEMLTQTCGVDVGLCTEGDQTCSMGIWGMCSGQGPVDELCDLEDNDCDGLVDEEVPTAGPCGVDVGDCQTGVLTCISVPGCVMAGDCFQCVGAQVGGPEECDGADNDCDGVVDNGLTRACGTDVGECAVGTETCVEGGPPPGEWAGCDAITSIDEVCDGLDNDCDGLTDEMIPTQGPCGLDIGDCSPGVLTCIGTPGCLGMGNCLQCLGASNGGPEFCDGVDNDCDMMTDEMLMQDCGSDQGECMSGSETCILGEWMMCSATGGPNDELCDTLDNDCDGLFDEMNPEGGTPCGVSDVGVCEKGIEKCIDGMLECIGEKMGGPEICDGLDNNCNGIVDEGNPEAGDPCGDDTGECMSGITACTGGVLICQGGVMPIAEVCNALDDDCDGVVDDGIPVGAPCGTDEGQCVPGLFICTGGALMCDGGVGETPEICDTLDNDCDGDIDEMLPQGGVCGTNEGLCEEGNFQCIDGKNVCVGEIPPSREDCDCQDNDCDGNVDEDPDSMGLCPGASECIDCQCALPCQPINEFNRCPTGRFAMETEDSCFCVEEQCTDMGCLDETVKVAGDTVCAPDEDGVPACVCRNNGCTFPCEFISCESGTTCHPFNGNCVEDNCRGLGCPEDEFCDVEMLECRTDPCAGVECDDGELCREGECEKSCADVVCDPNETCTSGSCSIDNCFEVNCDTGLTCDPATGGCVENKCVNVACIVGAVCDKVTGECGLDPCVAVRCPDGQECADGDCFLPIGTMLDGGATISDAGTPTVQRPTAESKDDPEDRVVAAGGGGCGTCTVGRGGREDLRGLWLALGLLGVLVMRRRRIRAEVPWAVGAVLAAAFWLSGCSVDPFCVTCSDRDGEVPLDITGIAGGRPLDGDGGLFGDAGLDGGDPVMTPVDAGKDTGQTCGMPEECNGKDDDCDDEIDEEFNLDKDPSHCGGCNELCAPANAFGACVKGECVIDRCDVGAHNLNLDFDDGCEYTCLEIEEGAEDDATCDGRDDDCDDEIDEDIDFDSDVLNCGKCGVVCAFNHASSTCEEGSCTFAACDPGFHDADGTKATGCEYECTPADPATEVCNLEDDDCDGKVDEGDPGGGVACGIDTGLCAFGTTQCVGGSVQCIGGTEPATELCNDTDDDCDGPVDENDPEGGRLCGPTMGACAQGREECMGGSLICTGIVGPTLEVCDGIDNDCDGNTDEGNPGGGGDCGTDEGECTFGSEVCVAGVFQCMGGTPGSAEQCDTLDNDCDGDVDEGDPFGAQGGLVCGESEGQCKSGREECETGTLVCKNFVPPATETCNGLDDDCDGVIDNDSDPVPPVPCGNTTGACAATQGFELCMGGIFVCMGDTRPQDELCDGVDNDCDGAVDEDDLGDPVVPGAEGGRLCGSGEGLCVKGTEHCIGGGLQCIGAQGPFTEVCDGLDNDCDAVVDNDSDPVPTESCGDDTGECTLGSRICSGGVIVCSPGVTPVAEICDTLDNDCDGDIDEGDTPAGAEGGKLCGTSEGTCSPGVQTCIGAPGCTVGVDCIECVGAQGPVAEACDGLDNDCDTDIDEDDIGDPTMPGAEGGSDCGTDVGECSFGMQHCQNGAFICVGGVVPVSELCDGKDNDCDGQNDNGNPESGNACGADAGAGLGVGQCVAGVQNCSGGTLVCSGDIGPSTETCNNLDDDCDGAVDEDDVGDPTMPGAEGGTACGNNGGVGACVQGVEQCQTGALVCTGGTGPSLEVCDDFGQTGDPQFDNDCDGVVDDGFDLMGDVNNCGVCGNVCVIANATPQCMGGNCEILQCDDDYHDLDPGTEGCEYFCVGNEFVPEICDGLDNDCDGEFVLDEAALVPPPNFCNSNGVCGDDPDTIPVDPTEATCGGVARWQCLYPPTYEPGFETSCDGLDNDCDGAIDEDFPLLGTGCSNLGTGACEDTGVLVCDMAGTGVVCDADPVGSPTDELCNDIDDDCDGSVDEIAADVTVPDPDGIDLTAIDTVSVLRSNGASMEIMRYEASRPDGTDLDDGEAGGYACSRFGVVPWTNVSFLEAQAACWGLNPGGSPQPLEGDDTPDLWRLCEAPDWARACRGPGDNCVWGYDTADCTASSSLTCNGEEYDSEPATPFDQDALFTTGSPGFPMCGADWVAAGLVYDLSGNAKEWTSTAQGTGIYEIRGGAYNNIEAGRTCDFDFVVAQEDFAHPNTGFRCCFY